MHKNKIPSLLIDPLRSVSLNERSERFVDLQDFSHGQILYDPKYLKAGRPGAASKAFLRLEAAERLLQASKALPHGYRFLIFDAWRPFSVQQSIYDEYFQILKGNAENRALGEKKLHLLTQKFVSLPRKDLRLSYVHSSGGAVDLTIVDAQGVMLDMGTDFDDFSPLARTDAFEHPHADPICQKNRRLLYGVLTEAGFTNYPEEWWHYDYGDLFWARALNKDALYSSYFDEKELPL